jgi:hypothetical protein
MAKVGVYRRLETVEILKDHSVYKKGQVREMHPVLAKRLIADDVAKVTKKSATNVKQPTKVNLKS